MNLIFNFQVKWRTGVSPSGGYPVGANTNFLPIYTLSLLCPFVFNKLEECLVGRKLMIAPGGWVAGV